MMNAGGNHDEVRAPLFWMHNVLLEKTMPTYKEHLTLSCTLFFFMKEASCMQVRVCMHARTYTHKLSFCILQGRKNAA